jgi:hypothetical protein
MVFTRIRASSQTFLGNLVLVKLQDPFSQVISRKLTNLGIQGKFIPSSGMSIWGNSFHNQWNPRQTTIPIPTGLAWGPIWEISR